MYNLTTSIKLIFIFALLTCTATISKATHVAGGTMTYRCLDNDRYEITMEFRRDCLNGDEAAPFDDPAHFGVYDKDNRLITFSVLDDQSPSVNLTGAFNIPLTTNDTLIETLTTECDVISGDVCIQTTVYRDTIRLPRIEGGYTIIYQRCCRNISLNNIQDPLNTGATYSVKITEEALNLCNSSPSWDSWPSIYICADDTLLYSHSAIDPDGDSLVYSLCTPQAGLDRVDNIWEAPPINYEIQEVAWAQGYSLSNLFGGGDPLVINEQTGDMYALPPAISSQFLVGVCVSEYRDGKLLSVIERDFEYNIRPCGRAPIANAAPDAFQKCNSLEIDFSNNSTSNFKPIDSLDFTWFFDYPNDQLVSNEVAPTFTYPSSGVYNVALVVSDGTCVDTAFTTVAVATNDDPALSFDLTAINCYPNNLINLQANHNIPTPLDSLDFQWTIVRDGISEIIYGPNPQYNIGTAQEVMVTLNIVGPTGCTSTYTETQTIATEQNPTIAFELDAYNCNSITTIELTSDIISDEVIDPDNIVWMINANGQTTTITGANPTFDIIEDQNINVTVQVTTPNGCTNSANESFAISTSPDPEISFTYSATNCNAATILALSGVASSATQTIDPNSYTWLVTTSTNQAYQGNGVIFSQNIEVDQVVTVQLQVSSLEGCTTTYTESIQVITTPFSPIFNDQTVCPGETALVYANTNPGNTVTLTPTPSNLIVDANGNYLVPDMQSTTVYTVTVQNADCSTTENVIITVDSNPTFQAIDDVVQCGDNTIQLNPAGVPSYVYQWEGPAGTTFDNNAVNPTLSVLTSGTFFVTISTSAASNCLAFDTIEVNRVEFPTLSFEPNRELIYCENDSINISAVSNGTVTWFDENNNQILTGNELIVEGLTESVIYTVVSLTPEGCSTEDQVEIQFIASPEIVIDPQSPRSSCFGEDLTVSVITDNLVSWQNEAGELIATGSEVTLPAFDRDTTLLITVENDLGCTSQESIFLEVLDLPEVDPAIDEESICRDVSFVLESGLDQYDVVVFDNMGNIISTEHETEIVDGLDMSTFYIFEFTTADGCVASDTTYINVFDEVGLTINAGATEQVYCRGFVPDLNATTNVDADIEWYVDGELVSSGDTFDTYIPNGDEQVIAIATTVDFCTQSDTIQLRQDFAEGTISGDDVICIGETATLTYNAEQTTDFTINWTPNDTISSEGTSIIVSPEETTTYTATYENENGCLDTTDFILTVGGFGTAPDIFVSEPEICRTQSTDLEVDVTGNNTVVWTPEESLDNPNVTNPTATPEETTTYTVSVIDEFGCETSNSITVNVIQPTCDERDVFIPNMFTPNFDDINDVFQVESAFLASMTLVVYNRWGEEVFETETLGEGWDGTFQGKVLDPDVYGYYFTGVCVNGFTVQMQGNVTLIK